MEQKARAKSYRAPSVADRKRRLRLVDEGQNVRRFPGNVYYDLSRIQLSGDFPYNAV